MSQLFSTDAVPSADRIDAWQWNAQQVCGDCRIELPKSSFHGSIEVRTVGGVRLTRFVTTPLSFWKWPVDNANVDNRSCLVITQVVGVRRYLQKGSSVVLKPGDSTLIDTGVPWSSNCGTDCTRLYLRVPRWVMESRLRILEIPTARRIAGDTPLGESLSRLSQCIFDKADLIGEAESAAALDAYFEILGACLTSGVIPVYGGAEAQRKIQHYIVEHIAEPELSAEEIASAVGISVRHLHRLFAIKGSTLGDCIRSCRLEHCRNDLANPRWQGRTITEIAFSWGFNDSAHFSHSFRKQFGISPRAFRARSVPGTQKTPRRPDTCNAGLTV
jgi:AraC-like DNA-binding protein